MRAWVKVSPLLIVLTLVLASAPVDANPAVPYCDTSGPQGGSSQTADRNIPVNCELATGRVFPEAIVDDDYVEGQGPNGFTGTGPFAVDDYVGYFEFQQGLFYLAETYPDYIEIHEVAMSYGNPNVAGGPEQNPIYILEITNENSPIAREDKLNLLFMLSIHGNEKGGREGGFRVLEDMLKNIGMATETVQNGAGMPEALAKPTGGNVETYFDYLDFMSLFLLFPNADGWACDEAEYGQGGGAIGPTPAGSGCGGQFQRVNGNGQDLNRQTPTIGWQNPGRQVLGEPESGGDGEYPGFANWLIEQRDEPTNLVWNYAIDIHGMINHQNFGAIMLPAGSMTPQEMIRSVSLAQTLKERWNLDAQPGGHFEEWATAFEGMETVWDTSGPAGASAYDQACSNVDCPLPGSALFGSNPAHTASSSQFAEYYTVIDAIGYTDSGFNGDFFAQSTGLNAPGYDIELAYNHLNCGSQYQNGACAQFNDYHVWMVRHIVKSFMDAAALDVKISYDTGGLQTAYIESPYVATNLDDVDEDNNLIPTPGGWADQTPNDDNWDYGLDTPFTSRPAKYWEDIEPFLCTDCNSATKTPGVLTKVNPTSQSISQFETMLANHDNLIISGSAINHFVEGSFEANTVAEGEVSQAHIDAILAWVEEGGNLVLTDSALEFFDLAGFTDDGVHRTDAYMGGIRMDLEHELLNKVRGGVKQTYEPTPLGWGTSGSAPNWGIDPAQFDAIDGSSVAGLVCGGSQLSQNCEGNDVALGYVEQGAGRITFMGAVLPDATEEFYHPYGLDDYATTYSGNQIVRNMLQWDEVFAAPPIVIDAAGQIIQTPNEIAPGAESAEPQEEGAPGAGVLLGLLALFVALVARKR